MSILRRAVPLVPLLLLVACESAVPADECRVSGDCPSGMRCRDGSCVPAPDGGDTTDGTVACLSGLTRCDAECVDTAQSAVHCGRCGLVCDPGESCIESMCLGPCLSTETRCGTSCVDTMSDDLHCDRCNRACAAEDRCETGECVPRCTPTEPPDEVCDTVDNDCDGVVDPPDCDSGLVVWHRFDRADGDAFDSSGRGHHGTFENTAVRETGGLSGSSLRLDGARDSRVEIPDHPDLSFTTAFTAEAWLFVDSCTPPASTHNTVAAIEAGFLFAFTTACQVANYVYTDGAWRSDSPVASLPIGRWVHYAMSWDGAQLVSYIDGDPVSAGTAVGGTMNDPVLPLHIGSRHDCACTQAFQGRIDELKIWSVGRTHEQVCTDAGGEYDSALSGCRL